MHKRTLLIIATLACGVAFAGEVKRERYDFPYKGEKELDVSIAFGLGNLNLQSCADPNYILRSEMIYSEEQYRPIVTYKVLGNRGRLRLETKKEAKESWKKHKQDFHTEDKNVWNLEFTTQVPSSYDIALGLGEGRLNFSKIPVQDLRLNCGLSDVKMQFDVSNPENLRMLNIGTGLGSVEIRGLGNANVERFDIECGLGSTEIYFEGSLKQDGFGKIRVGLGSVKIMMPDNIAVEVRAESSFLSSLDLRGFDRIGEKNYRSGNWSKAKHRIYLDIEVGLGSVEFRWLD